MPNAQFFNPQNELEAKRRMRMAQMLQEASQTPQAPAGTVVAQSPWAALARGVVGGIGNIQEQEANSALAKDAVDKQEFLQKAVSENGNDPKKLAQALLSNPSTADAGLSLYGKAIDGDQMSAYQAAMLGLQGAKFNAEYPTDPRTGLPKKEPKISVRDEIRMAKSEEAAQAAMSVEQLGTEAQDILKRYETNKASKIVGGFGQVANALGMADDETKAKVRDYERIDKISKELGSKTLAQFGGNDTDKELQVAIQSNLDPDALVETNMITLQKKLAAASILQRKPDFEAQWVAKNGGLNNLDVETGRSFQSEWLKTQREMWKEANPPKSGTKQPLTAEELQFLESHGIKPDGN